jgi:hypothetical protein
MKSMSFDPEIYETPDPLEEAAMSAECLVTVCEEVRSLKAVGKEKQASVRLHFLNSCTRPEIRAINRQTELLRRTRASAFQSGDCVAPTAHEAAIEMISFANGHWSGVKTLGRALKWPDPDVVIAEIKLETSKAYALRPLPRPAPNDERGGRTRNGATHSDDFRSVNWYGKPFTFTATQAACIGILWKARENGTPGVGQGAILDSAGSTGSTLRDVFNKGKHPAWNSMVVSSGKGAFRLAEAPRHIPA